MAGEGEGLVAEGLADALLGLAGGAYARDGEGDGDVLLGDVELQAVPGEHHLHHRGHAPAALEEGQESPCLEEERNVPVKNS